MPRFLAYICPRTDKLFKEKDVYVAHLRELARASLTEKRIRREMQPLHDSFAMLRMSAKSDSSVLDWLVVNRAEVIRLAHIIKPDMVKSLSKAYKQAGQITIGVRTEKIGRVGRIKSGRQVDTNLEEPFRSSPIGTYLPSVEIQFSARGLQSSFLGAAAEVLKKLPGLYVTNGDNRSVLECCLYAEDWPYIAEEALLSFRSSVGNEKELDYSLTRIIDKRYPTRTFEAFAALCKSGLLDDEMLGAPALSHWLHPVGEAALALPALSHGSNQHDYFGGTTGA
jgi:hypothetical protein